MVEEGEKIETMEKFKVEEKEWSNLYVYLNFNHFSNGFTILNQFKEKSGPFSKL